MPWEDEAREREEDETKISKQLKILFFKSQFVCSSHGRFHNFLKRRLMEALRSDVMGRKRFRTDPFAVI